MRRIAKGDGSPVASPPKAEVESGATMTAKPFARLRRRETPAFRNANPFKREHYEDSPIVVSTRTILLPATFPAATTRMTPAICSA